MISQAQDISERKELAARLECLNDLARHADRVTRYEARSAVLVIDRDNFKDVNDAFDHNAGDDLLKAVAGALRHRVRQTDAVAWVGRSEFAVLLLEALLARRGRRGVNTP